MLLVLHMGKYSKIRADINCRIQRNTNMIVRADEDFSYVVSLTSYPARIRMPEVPLVIYSIIRQKTSHKFKLVLVLSKLEFPNGFDDLPDAIQQFIKSGYVEPIWLADNLRAYKKWIGPHIKYPDKPIMTTDDDIILDSDIVDLFIRESKKHPGCIITEHGFELGHTGDIITGHFRLFPVGSLLDLPTTYFVECYRGLEDDAYNAYLATLKGTRTIILHSGKTHILETGGFVGTAFSKSYSKVSPLECRDRLANRLMRN